VTDRTAEELAAAVRDRPEHRRYELEVGGAMAFIDYRKTAGSVALLHAEVPPQFGSRGIGAALVRGTLRLARAESLQIQPYCGFVVAMMRRHPEW
jgi:hypothetical protein